MPTASQFFTIAVEVPPFPAAAGTPMSIWARDGIVRAEAQSMRRDFFNAVFFMKFGLAGSLAKISFFWLICRSLPLY